jgi:hypothetical protein
LWAGGCALEPMLNGEQVAQWVPACECHDLDSTPVSAITGSRVLVGI